MLQGLHKTSIANPHVNRYFILAPPFVYILLPVNFIQNLVVLINTSYVVMNDATQELILLVP